MESLSELFRKPIESGPPPQKQVKLERQLSPPIVPTKNTVPAQYEAEVFNFMLANKASLGIKAVDQFSGVLVDGAVELEDGSRLALEIKLKMNWNLACRSGWQFEGFLKTQEAEQNAVVGGLVVFQEFTADWARTTFCRPLQDGWCRWYEGHCVVDEFPVHLARLRSAEWETIAKVGEPTRRQGG